MCSWLIVVIVLNFLIDLLSAARNASKELLDCTTAGNATGRAGVAVALCKPSSTTGVRGHDEQPSYNMLTQAAYGLTAITIIVVAYFVFRTMRFVQFLKTVSLLLESLS